MATEFRTSAAPYSAVKTDVLNVQDTAFMNIVEINNVIVENAYFQDIEVANTIIYNTLTNGEVTI